ncbi:hypothetical protein I4U23_001276 [Adineta vaga]|nr:hypothetical protein I4U23_001276 [Adineta vaga]
MQCKGSINTWQPQAVFLAQLAHESSQLVYMEEIASVEAYEGRKDFGTIQPGDGKRLRVVEQFNLQVEQF